MEYHPKLSVKDKSGKSLQDLVLEKESQFSDDIITRWRYGLIAKYLSQQNFNPYLKPHSTINTMRTEQIVIQEVDDD